MNDRAIPTSTRTEGTRAGSLCRRAVAGRPSASSRWTLGALLLLWGTGCSTSFGGAVHSYEHAQYPQAMEELRVAETDACRFGRSDAARYALYRGLTHLALGDVAATRRWFARLERAMDVDPALLSADDAARLAAAQAHLPR